MIVTKDVSFIHHKHISDSISMQMLREYLDRMERMAEDRGFDVATLRIDFEYVTDDPNNTDYFELSVWGNRPETKQEEEKRLFFEADRKKRIEKEEFEHYLLLRRKFEGE